MPVCTLLFQTDQWRLSYINKDFSICPSYPPVVIVPKSIDDETLQKVAAYRHGGRFPVLSYYHKKNGMVSCIWLVARTWKRYINLLRSPQPSLMTNNLCSRLNAVHETFSHIIFQLIFKLRNCFWVMEWVISILEVAINMLVWAHTWHELVSSCP